MRGWRSKLGLEAGAMVVVDVGVFLEGWPGVNSVIDELAKKGQKA